MRKFLALLCALIAWPAFAQTVSPPPGGGGGGTPGGSNTQLQYNNSSAFGGIATLTWNGSTLTDSQASALSAPAMTFTGAPITGGTGTTAVPLFYLNTGASAPTDWSTNGTTLGINCVSTGFCLQIEKNGTFIFSIDNNGNLNMGGASNFIMGAADFLIFNGSNKLTTDAAGSLELQTAAGTNPNFFNPAGTGILQFGQANSATPVAQTLQAQGSRGGTDSNIGGGALTIASGDGTGTGTIATLTLKTPHLAASGTTQQTMNSQITIGDNLVAINQVTTGTNADFVCLNSSQQFTIQASACTISSARFKEHIAPFKAPVSRDLALITPVTFTLRWLANDIGRVVPPRDPNANANQIGLLAEDVARVFPKCAIYENDMKTPKSYRQECMIAVLVKSAQEQQAEIDSLKRQLRRR